MLLAKLVAFPTAAIMMVVGAAGMDMEYEGEVDIYSGLPASGSAAETSQKVALSSGVTYDRTTHMFRYTTPDNSGEIECSVADGMVTTGKVSVVLPSGYPAALYLEGEELTDTDYTELTAPGAYSLVLTGPDSQSQLLSFEIVAEKTGALNFYQMPSGFKLTKAARESESIAVIGKDSVDMSEEGYYQITYRCNATGVDYYLNVQVDHTPPQVSLEGLRTDGTAKNPVKITGLSDSDRVYLTLNEKQISVPMEKTLKTPGEYHLSVTDEAGNNVTEDFTIEFYLNMQGLVFTLLAVGVAAAVFIYMYISKKRLKVR